LLPLGLSMPSYAVVAVHRHCRVASPLQLPTARGRVCRGRLAELATPRLHRPELPRVHPREPPAPPPSPWPLEPLPGPSSPPWRAAAGEQQLPPLQPPPVRGQATVGHLGPSRGLRRVRAGPGTLPATSPPPTTTMATGATSRPATPCCRPEEEEDGPRA